MFRQMFFFYFRKLIKKDYFFYPPLPLLRAAGVTSSSSVNVIFVFTQVDSWNYIYSFMPLSFRETGHWFLVVTLSHYTIECHPKDILTFDTINAVDQESTF